MRQNHASNLQTAFKNHINGSKKNLPPRYNPLNESKSLPVSTKLTWLEPPCASVSLSWSSSRSQQRNRTEKEPEPVITKPVRRHDQQPTGKSHGRLGKIEKSNDAAGKALKELFKALAIRSSDRIMIIGGQPRQLILKLARNLNDPRNLMVIDSKQGDAEGTSRHAISAVLGGYRFMVGNVIEIMNAEEEPFDLIVVNRMIGKLPMVSLFAAAGRILRPGGKLALVTPREDYSSLPVALLYNLAAEDPYAVIRLFTLDYPEDINRIKTVLNTANMVPEKLWEKTFSRTHNEPESLFEHLIGTEVGAVVFDSVDLQQRGRFKDMAIEELKKCEHTRDGYRIEENYICCVAVKQ